MSETKTVRAAALSTSAHDYSPAGMHCASCGVELLKIDGQESTETESGYCTDCLLDME